MTIKDIAKLSGYGIGTVSRVLNNQPGVSEKAKEKILQVIKESNYEPNENARYLKRRSGSSIGIIIKGNQNLLFAGVLEEIQARLAAIEEDVVVEYIGEDGDEVEFALRLLRDRSPKGIMFLGANLNNFNERVDNIEVPCIIVTTDGERLENKRISSVCVDDEYATYQMMKYLIENGHTKIGLIGGNLDQSQTSFKRYAGCKKAMDECGIDFSPKDHYISCKYSIEDGYHASKQLLERDQSITALVAMSDTIAIGAMRAIADLGLRIPEDISVTGFDGIPMSDYCIPRLTTIQQDAIALATRSVELLLQRVHYDMQGQHEKVHFELLKRESVLNRNK